MTPEIRLRKEQLEILNNSEIALPEIFQLAKNISKERVDIYKELYFGVGNTPIYCVNLRNKNRLFIKKETENSFGNNHYSRYWLIYLFLMEDLEIINPQSSKLIEISSGSSGISMSLVCKALGYDLTLIIPEILPTARTKTIVENDTTIIFSKGYIGHCVKIIKEKLIERTYFHPNHSEEPNEIIINVFKRISSEINNQINIDYLISGIGNGTSSIALFDYPYKNGIQKVGYYPFFESQKIIYGLYGPNVKLRHIEKAISLCDKLIDASSIDINWVREQFPYDTEILSLGESSLIGIGIAKLISEKEAQNKNFVTIAYDSILRY